MKWIPAFKRPARAAAWLVGVTAGLVLAGCSLLIPVPENLDLSTTRASERGLYRATITPPIQGIPRNRIHSWELQVQDAAGQPVTAARIGVDGDMPQHLHGLPTRPEASAAAGEGRYRVDGLRFNMGGWWTVSFKVDGPQGVDTVTFNLML